MPIKLFTKLLNEADDKGIAIGVYIREILSKDNFSQVGETKIEYRDRILEKKVEVPIYRDRILEKKVEIDNPKIIKENVALKKQIELLEIEIKKLTPITEPQKTEGFCGECNKNVKLEEGKYCIKCGSLTKNITKLK